MHIVNCTEYTYPVMIVIAEVAVCMDSQHLPKLSIASHVQIIDRSHPRTLRRLCISSNREIVIRGI